MGGWKRIKVITTILQIKKKLIGMNSQFEKVILIVTEDAIHGPKMNNTSSTILIIRMTKHQYEGTKGISNPSSNPSSKLNSMKKGTKR